MDMLEITAPMPGKVCEVNVKVGDSVIKDQELLFLEAMKMEMPIVATEAGTVTAVNCAVEDAVTKGDVLVTIE
jgi:biotin carboxyl carrier protein